VLPVAASLGCLAAVLLAGALGPPTFSSDSPLDRFRLGGGQLDTVTVDLDVVSDDDPVPVTTREGIPIEVVLSLAVAVVAGALLARSVLRARHEDVDDPEEGPDEEPAGAGAAVALAAVAGAARRGLGRLGDPGSRGPGSWDPGDAVLACWVELEAAGDRLGSGRAPTDTPTDFAVRLAAAVPGLDGAVLADLRRTYSRVRYGCSRPGAVGPDDVRRARAALQHLLAVLGPGDRQEIPR